MLVLELAEVCVALPALHELFLFPRLFLFEGLLSMPLVLLETLLLLLQLHRAPVVVLRGTSFHTLPVQLVPYMLADLLVIASRTVS